MPRLKTKSVIVVVGTVFALGLFAALPWMRSWQWRRTQYSTRVPTLPRTEAEIEQEKRIEEATAVDDTEFSPKLGIRYLTRVPTTRIGLEAAFRQRKPDSAVMLPASEPLLASRFAAASFLPNDSNRSVRLTATRRPVFTIGLAVLKSDVPSLPWLSRSSILDFIEKHYVSLQASIVRDPVSGKDFLHHRPLAAVAKFGGDPFTHPFVSPITETVGDIRGLGIFLHPAENEGKTASDQTAVWLFRNLRMTETTPSIQFEYAFLRMTTEGDDAWRFRLILTSDNLNEWHLVSDSAIAQRPARSIDTTTQGTVFFTEYASDGLSPKTSATRSVRIKTDRLFTLREIIDRLTNLGDSRDWGEHLATILDYVGSASESSVETGRSPENPPFSLF